MTLPIYVINRAADETRLSAFADAAGDLALAFTRIEAIDGHDPDAPLFLYRDFLRDGFWGEDRIKPGAFACALSHRAAWKRMLADGAETALICEDDAPLLQRPDALAAAASRSADWDVIFANGRMAAWRAVGAAKSDPRLLPVSRIAARLAKSGEVPGAPGADCYLVSRKGAAALVDLLSETGVVAGVDWLIAAGALPAGSLPGEEAAFLDGAMTAPKLKAFVWKDPLADAKGAAPSAIAHSTTAAIETLRTAPSIHIGQTELPGARAPSGLRADPVVAAFEGGRFYEEPALEMMARWMPRGGVFVDIGAHVGGHTLFMLRHGGAGRAIAFEQNRFAIEGFGETILMNGLGERVDASHLGVGLGEEVGKREAKGGRRNPFVQKLKRGFDESVRIKPGDAILRDEAVDMIKIDVNGEEREALKGLKKTLKRKAPLLVMDMSHHRTAKAAPLLARLDYVEIERAVWTEGEQTRAVALFRSIAAPKIIAESEPAPPERED